MSAPSPPPLPALPAGVLHAIRRTGVPTRVRALFEAIPRTLSLEVTLPEEPTLSDAVRQILKLAFQGVGLRLLSVTRGPTGLRASLGARALELGEHDLVRGDATTIARRLLVEVCAPEDLAGALERFADDGAKKDVLTRLTRSMLDSADIDRASYVMLSGITSGAALGFHRAALFVHEPARDVFVGKKAIGPADQAEAHRIWEAIEYEDKTIEDLVADYGAENFDTRLQKLVHSLELATKGPNDEIARALSASGPVLFRDSPRNEGLARMGVRPEFLVAAIRNRGETHGLLVADNAFGVAPVTPDQIASLALFLDQLALVWEKMSLLARVERLARFDPLTGVFNRRAFDARFNEEQSRASRGRTPLSLLLIDIDQFKATNDTLGHEAGDQVLRTLGAVLRAGVRAHDAIGRFGGDEFAALLPETGREAMRAAAVRLGEQARAQGISLSVGGASWPDDCDETSALMAVADANLYAAKRAGRACACFGRGEVCRF